MKILKETLKDISSDKNGAIRVLFKGLSASLLLCGNGIATFTLYELSKTKLGYRPLEKFSASKEDLIPFFAGMATKTLTSTFFYPLTTIRTRLQQKQYKLIDEKSASYNKFIETVSNMWRREGPRSFYKGLSFALLKIVPSQGLFLMVYELCLKFMNAN